LNIGIVQSRAELGLDRLPVETEGHPAICEFCLCRIDKHHLRSFSTTTSKAKRKGKKEKKKKEGRNGSIQNANPWKICIKPIGIDGKIHRSILYSVWDGALLKSPSYRKSGF